MALEKVTLLVVEDNDADFRLVREYLKESSTVSFEVSRAKLLSDALKVIAEKKFDAALLDLDLPDSKGLSILDKLSGLDPSIAMLVLTGMDDEDLGIKAVKRGAQDYLVKGRMYGGLLCRSILYSIERKRMQVEVKILKGLLPICASCKQIRDDKGYWHKIESYIRDHSEAEFSHGFCPECAERLYPEFNPYKNKS